MKSKIIIQFNEANFDLIEKYVLNHNLPGFKKILDLKSKINTFSEQEYSYLEPWIQWYSFYTGKTYSEHKVFHLGDCNLYDHEIFTEEFAKKDKAVGIFGSMNLKYSQRYKIFLPDAWTNTKTDKSYSSILVSKVLKQIINKNTNLRISLFDIIGILMMVGIPKNFYEFKKIFDSLVAFIKKDRTRLASLFDCFFLNYSLRRLKRNNLNLSLIFLNGFAHIQHHFMLSSKFVEGNNPDWYIKSEIDPIYEALKIYDETFYSILNEYSNQYEFWIITGLTQQPYRKPKVYWRLKDPANVIEYFTGVKLEVNKRMSRDFELLIANKEDAYDVLNFLKEAYVIKNNKKSQAFGFIDQTSDSSIFSSFIYGEIESDFIIVYKDLKLHMKNKVDFVALKNGKHCEKGWAFTNCTKNNSVRTISISKLSNEIIN